MRILIHSNAPWVPTGYGTQARMLGERLKGSGHTVAFSAFSGLSGADIRWHGYEVMPSGQLQFGVDMLLTHAQRFRAELIITLMDFYKLAPLGKDLTSVCPVLAWTPVDCSPLSKRDEEAFQATGAIPVAMSRFGQSSLATIMGGTGNVHYAPHMVECDKYYPMKDREDYRRELGVTNQFVIGICAANKDHIRKGFAEQFRAFGLFLRHHPDSMLLVHSVPRSAGGQDLIQLAFDMGIIENVRFSEPYVQDSGLFATTMMRRWYNALDVLSLCSYGEGFGIPLIEAQACGTPVVTTDGSAMTELAGGGYLVRGSEFWNPVHQAFWTRPDVDSIVKGYKFFSNMAPMDMFNRRQRARDFALDYNADDVCNDFWAPIIDSMRARTVTIVPDVTVADGDTTVA